MSDTYNEPADYVRDDAQAAAPSVASQPAIKARKQSPQTDVNQFWQRFTTKYPGKVTSILPADVYAKNKAQHSPKGLVWGQNAGKSYEQAVAECKDAVIKIAKECRRVNAKYRDPHFDIEFDLKRDRRDCLDSLQPTGNDDRHWPRSVKRVADIFEKPTFYEDDATASDIRQGFNGDCWFLAALCAISNKKHLIENSCVARDEPVGVYGFVFHRDGEWIHTIIDDKLYLIASDWWESTDEEKRTIGFVQRDDAEKHYQNLNQTGSKALYFAQCRSENETWLPLLEKAYAKAHGYYSAIDGGFTGEAIEDLTGGVTVELFTTDILDKDKFWNEEIMKVNDEFLFGCATGSFDKWQNSDVASQAGARGGIIRLHAYSIMDAVEKKGHRLVKVRNPWATDEWRGAWSDGAEQWTGEWLELLNHTFGDDGIFWISYEDLLKKYSNFDRTRLFGKDWQVVQQWTTVNVPWTADYNETKFSLVVTKQSPIVIALSQLDGRYFKGLVGQYFFELHFRLSKDGAEDYIVRSHGNYSMRRSVSTDIELEPGKYSVLIRVTAQRDDTRPVPEAVIKDSVKDRQNKLIQVGLAYDLAHAKGEIRENEAEKHERRELDRKKRADEKNQKRKVFRKEKVKEFERKKREKAREKRQAKRKEEYERKKAAKQKANDEPASGQAAVAADVKTKGGEEAAATTDTTNTTKVGEIATETSVPIHDSINKEVVPSIEPLQLTDSGSKNNPDSNENSLPETKRNGEGTIDAGGTSNVPEPSVSTTTNSTNTNGKPDAHSTSPETSPNPTTKPNSDDTNITPDAGSTKLTETAVKAIPAVTVNGVPPPPSTNPAAPSSLAAGDNNDGDDGTYDSDASFVSSIDSILDLDLPDPASDSDSDSNKIDTNTKPIDNDNDNTANNDDDDDENDNTFTSDPWNAVCVVGLRVYSKDPGCSVSVVRPKEPGGEETVLDLDDASKGVSGEAAAAAAEAEAEADKKKSPGRDKDADVQVEVKTAL